jgi:chromosome segregation ATPase
MSYIPIAIAALLAVIIPLAGFFFGRRSGFKASNEDAAKIREESRDLETKLIDTLSNVESLASKAQVNFLRQQCEAFRRAIGEHEQSLEGLTERVETIRQEVVQREDRQQELRAMREEDQVAITHALTRYTEFSTESLSLEQKLAESLRTLDAMAGEIKMTTDQKAIFTELSNALTQASAQLRDVIIDYQNANERLANLRSRFNDLENEYSKLVEQQLAN